MTADCIDKAMTSINKDISHNPLGLQIDIWPRCIYLIKYLVCTIKYIDTATITRTSCNTFIFSKFLNVFLFENYASYICHILTHSDTYVSSGTTSCSYCTSVHWPKNVPNIMWAKAVKIKLRLSWNVEKVVNNSSEATKWVQFFCLSNSGSL